MDCKKFVSKENAEYLIRRLKPSEPIEVKVRGSGDVLTDVELGENSITLVRGRLRMPAELSVNVLGDGDTIAEAEMADGVLTLRRGMTKRTGLTEAQVKTMLAEELSKQDYATQTWVLGKQYVNSAALATLHNTLTQWAGDYFVPLAAPRVERFGGRIGNITLQTNQGTTGAVNFAMSGNMLTGMVAGLGTLASKDALSMSDMPLLYIGRTRVQGAESEQSLQGIDNLYMKGDLVMGGRNVLDMDSNWLHLNYNYVRDGYGVKIYGDVRLVGNKLYFGDGEAHYLELGENGHFKFSDPVDGLQATGGGTATNLTLAYDGATVYNAVTDIKLSGNKLTVTRGWIEGGSGGDGGTATGAVTAGQVRTAINNALGSYYTKSEVDNKLKSYVSSSALNDYLKKDSAYIGTTKVQATSGTQELGGITNLKMTGSVYMNNTELLKYENEKLDVKKGLNVAGDAVISGTLRVTGGKIILGTTDNSWIQIDDDGHFQFSKGIWTNMFVTALGRGTAGEGGGTGGGGVSYFTELEEVQALTSAQKTNGSVWAYTSGGWGLQKLTVESPSGSGNAITSLTVSGLTVTPVMGKTFAEKSELSNYAPNSALNNYLPLAGGTMKGQIIATSGNIGGGTGEYGYAKNNALLYMPYLNGSWRPVVGLGTAAGGDWSLGIGVGSSDKEQLYARYTSKSNSTADVTTYALAFPLKNGTLATTSDNVASATRLDANGTSYLFGQKFWDAGKPQSYAEAASKALALNAGRVTVEGASGADSVCGAVKGTASVDVRVSTANVMGVYGGTSGKNWLLGSDGSTKTWLAVGNVGIGTVTPGYKLDVVGDTRVSGDLLVSNSGKTMTFKTDSSQFYMMADANYQPLVYNYTDKRLTIGRESYKIDTQIWGALYLGGPNGVKLSYNNGALEVSKTVCSLQGVSALGAGSTSATELLFTNRVTMSGGATVGGALTLGKGAGKGLSFGGSDAKIYAEDDETTNYSLLYVNGNRILLGDTREGASIYGLAPMVLNKSLQVGSGGTTISKVEIVNANGTYYLKIAATVNGSSVIKQVPMT